MVRYAVEHTRFAGAADPFGASVIGSYSRTQQGFENGLACADLDRPVAPRKPDLETAFDRGRFPGLEILNMHMAGGTIRRRSLECFEHRQWAAAIEGSSRGRSSTACWKIEHAPGPLIVKVDMHFRGPVRSKRIELVEKCRGAPRPGGV